MRRRLSLRGAFSDFAQRRGISTRLLILFIVLFAIAVTLAPPTQHYFAQRAQISALEAFLKRALNWSVGMILIMSAPKHARGFTSYYRANDNT
ncbi:MAG: hypothetical protein RL159_623 [Actinomycetota bacterium]